MTSIRVGNNIGPSEPLQTNGQGSDRSKLVNWAKFSYDSNNNPVTSYNNADGSGEGYNTACFNVMYAAKQAEEYTIKEKAYGEYDKEVLAISIWQGLLDKVKAKLAEIESRIDYSKVKTALKNTRVAIKNAREKVGYTEEDLNRMAANGFDLLKEAYNDSLNKARANYNRLGLANSGFEIAAKFGKQQGSITETYFKNVRQLQNEIAVKGLEAEREDRHKIASLYFNYAEALNKSDGNWLQLFEEGALKVLFQNEEFRMKWAELNGKEAQSDFENIRKILEYFGDILVKDEERTNQLKISLIQAVGLAGQGGKDSVTTLATELQNGATAAANPNATTQTNWASLFYNGLTNSTDNSSGVTQ